MKIYDSAEIEQALARLNRKAETDERVVETVRKIISDVAREGDKALFDYTRRFDGFELNEGNIRVTDAELDSAYEAVPKALIETMENCAAHIIAFHRMQRRQGFESIDHGAVTGRLVIPVQCAGVYVPGGKAAYPSSVLMNIIPAAIAGVKKIVMVTPPDKDGRIEPLTLVAARMAGANLILRAGGAQAIAALAYGTKSVPKADVITGPGNAYVAAAKREVYGTVGIDMIAGPSEVLIIADENASPAFAAADFLSQAEHDEQAASILITPSHAFAQKAAAEIERQLALLPRREIAEASVRSFGTIIVTETLEQAFEIANLIAPEHLEILTEEPKKYLSKIQNAGAVFLGEFSPEPLGDYYAGPNHVLPTSGTARFSSALSVDHFMKTTNYVYYDEKSLRTCYDEIARFARAEGLTAHERSVTIRFKREDTT
jgi:histidinol dehydrogenase